MSAAATIHTNRAQGRRDLEALRREIWNSQGGRCSRCSHSVDLNYAHLISCICVFCDKCSAVGGKVGSADAGKVPGVSRVQPRDRSSAPARPHLAPADHPLYEHTKPVGCKSPAQLQKLAAEAVGFALDQRVAVTGTLGPWEGSRGSVEYLNPGDREIFVRFGESRRPAWFLAREATATTPNQRPRRPLEAPERVNPHRSPRQTRPSAQNPRSDTPDQRLVGKTQ